MNTYDLMQKSSGDEGSNDLVLHRYARCRTRILPCLDRARDVVDQMS